MSASEVLPNEMEKPAKMVSEPPDRRGFLTGLVVAAGVSIATVLSGLLARFFAAPLLLKSREGASEVSLGPAARFRGARDPTPAVFERRVADGYLERAERGRVYVVAERDEFLCLSTTCTHLGCSVRWDAASGRFLCPCHGGVYARDGSVVSGPPPRPLQRLAARVEWGTLRVRLDDLA